MYLLLVKKWTRRELLPLMGAGIAGTSLLALASGDEKPNQRYVPDPLFARPERLKQGDFVGICAPAGALRREEEISEFTQILNEMGYRVKVGPNCTKKYGYFAGTDEERASDFMGFIQDPEVKAIFFLRGGWGCARLIPHLDFETISDNPKIIMGFSDITTLLNAITTQCQMHTFHGPSGNSSWNDYSRSYVKRILEEGETVHFKNAPGDSEIITYASGKASGVLWGGNLTVICSLIGTEYLPSRLKGILFLEDVSEEPYAIDRMLTQLKMSEMLHNCKGIILGNFRKCVAEEPERSFTLEEVFEQHFKDSNIPVFFGAQIGHVVNKFTIPLGVTVIMDADNGELIMLESAVI